jgi:tetratricopeptide (TPR) repeat protein
VLLKLRRLDDAAAHARLALKVAPESERRARASAHEMLVKIALARQDGVTARREAALAQEADPTLPLPVYVEGLMLHTQGRYADALPKFLEALRYVSARTLTMTELHFYLGDTLARLGRNPEAEAEFRKEIELFPQNHRAYASLAMLYRSLGRDAEAERAIADLVSRVPTSEAYGLAAQLWTIFGDDARAGSLRAEARRRFGRALDSEAPR